MASDGAEMRRALAREVVPALKAAGFNGKHPHYRRTVGGQMDLLSFQVDKRGGGFLIELATCTARDIRDWAGHRVSPRTVTTQHMFDRVRLPKVITRREWYRYDASESADRFERIALRALAHLQQRGLVS